MTIVMQPQERLPNKSFIVLELEGIHGNLDDDHQGRKPHDGTGPTDGNMHLFYSIKF